MKKALAILSALMCIFVSLAMGCAPIEFGPPPQEGALMTKVDTKQTEKAQILSLNYNKITIEEGESREVCASLKPGNTTKKIRWESDAREFSIKSEDGGKRLIITGEKAGSASIVASVIDDKSDIKPVLLKVEVIKRPDISFDKKSLAIIQKEFKELFVTKTRGVPVSWKASKENWVKLTPIANGVQVYGLKPGEGSITATTEDGRSKSITVTIAAAIEMNISKTKETGNYDEGTYLGVDPRLIYPDENNSFKPPKLPITWSFEPLDGGATKDGLAFTPSRGKNDPNAERTIWIRFKHSGRYRVYAKTSYMGQNYSASCEITVRYEFRSVATAHSFTGKQTYPGDYEGKNNKVILQDFAEWTLTIVVTPDKYDIGKITYSTTFADKQLEVKQVTPRSFAIKRKYSYNIFGGRMNADMNGAITFYADKVKWKKTFQLETH